MDIFSLEIEGFCGVRVWNNLPVSVVEANHSTLNMELDLLVDGIVGWGCPWLVWAWTQDPRGLLQSYIPNFSNVIGSQCSWGLSSLEHGERTQIILCPKTELVRLVALYLTRAWTKKPKAILIGNTAGHIPTVLGVLTQLCSLKGCYDSHKVKILFFFGGPHEVSQPLLFSCICRYCKYLVCLCATNPLPSKSSHCTPDFSSSQRFVLNISWWLYCLGKCHCIYIAPQTVVGLWNSERSSKFTKLHLCFQRETVGSKEI